MRVVLISNYYNHHQSAFSTNMNRITCGEFTFIEMERMTAEHKALGYGLEGIPDYVKYIHRSDETYTECCQLINSADVVIFENTFRFIVLDRLKEGKLTFLYSERIYKRGYEMWKWPIRFIRNQKANRGLNSLYLLCASAFTAADYKLTFNFINKTYKWGYFPKVKQYDIDKLLRCKLSEQSSSSEKSCASILWVGRLIKWKHPDASIRLAKSLKEKGYSFRLDIIGKGEMENKLLDMINANNLSDCVTLLGAMTPVRVREHMEQADIYLFTSDFNEGWGAVLNESMNSGCAVVASHAIGSVPFLIKNGENGMVYQNGNEKDLLRKVEILLKDSVLRKKMGAAAYRTMLETWNADIAASRLLELSKDLLKSGNSKRYCEGPCSKAEVLKNGWFKI